MFLSQIDMTIFIKKYRPHELAVWEDGTERGRHPEDERTSKRPPTSGAGAAHAKKPSRWVLHIPQYTNGIPLFQTLKRNIQILWSIYEDKILIRSASGTV